MAQVDKPIGGQQPSASVPQMIAYLRRNNPAIGIAEAGEIVAAYAAIGIGAGIDSAGAFAQACHETNLFRFGNQVRKEQHNPAGIGATNDGAAGHSWPNWAAGVAAHYYHLCAWAKLPGGNNSIRYKEVTSAAKTKGYARTWRDLGGRWAVPGDGYGDGIERHWQGILSEAGTAMAAPKIAIASGHHNTDGGDPFEAQQTGELTRAVARHCRALGMDVRVVTPADGLGLFAGGIWDVARAVVALVTGGWVPDIFIETHTEGGGGKGVFAIYPDWTGDVDTDVRDKLGPLVARKVAAATGLAVGGRVNGTMSERTTGVGGQGFRLGIFGQTAPIKATTTRLIVEYGAHDKEPDLSIAKRAGFADKCGRATAEAFAEHLGYVPLVRAATEPTQTAKPMPFVDGADVTWVINERGEPVITINFGGNARQILGVNLADLGVSVQNADGEIYDRSIQGGAFKAWAKR